MSDPQVTAVEPDPAATSLLHDKSLNETMTTDAVADATKKESDTTAAKDTVAEDKAAEAKDDIKESEERDSAPKDAKRGDDNRRGRGGKFNDRKHYSRPQNRNKFREINLPESSDPDEIRKQVEFYLSDSNLSQDKFLMDQTGGYENKWVDISLFHSFKRMKHFQPFSAVVAALKDSEILEINDKNQIRRKTPLPKEYGKDTQQATEVYKDRSIPRSIYVKGFGEETSNSQFDIEQFFMTYGDIKSCRLRRQQADKSFKGSVFVEFSTEEEQKDFLALDPKPKYQNKELLIMSKEAYVKQKQEDIAAGKIKPTNYHLDGRYENNRGRGGHRGRGRGDRNGPRRDGDRRDRNGDDWKGRRDDFQKSREFKGGRGDRNDRKRGRDDNEKEESEPKKQIVDKFGIPIVRTTDTPLPKDIKPLEGKTSENEPSTPPAEVDPFAAQPKTPAPAKETSTEAPKEDSPTNGETKKRARDNDDVEITTAKKVKANEVTTES